MLEKINKFREYLDYIEEHYNNVQEAWKLINDKCPNDFRFMSDDFIWNTINTEVLNHDISKLSSDEFTQYRKHFFTCSYEQQDKVSFNNAWEHHKTNNVHHWQHWTQLKNTPYDDMYLVMNVVDWIAMGIKFGDTAKSYYEKNKDEIKLPDWAITLMYRIFEYIYTEQ